MEMKGWIAPFAAGAAFTYAVMKLWKPSIQRLNAKGEPWDGKGRAAPIVVHNGYVYISGQVGWKDKPGGEIDPSIEVQQQQRIINPNPQT